MYLKMTFQLSLTQLDSIYIYIYIEPANVHKSTMKVNERNPRTQGNTPYCNDMYLARAKNILKQVEKYKKIDKRGYI